MNAGPTPPPEASSKPAKPVLPEVPKSVKWLRGLAAILTLLLMASIIINFYLYSKFATYRKMYEEVKPPTENINR